MPVPPQTDWSYTKFNLVAVVYMPVDPCPPNGAPVQYLPVVIDVAQVTTTYGINEIPEANIQPAMGRDLATLAPAAIHQVINNMRQSLVIQIFMKATEMASSFGQQLDKWPVVRDANGDIVPDANGNPTASWFLIFDGYTTGAGFVASQRGGANFTISAKGWLIDLAYSCGLTRQSSCISPTQLSNAIGSPGQKSTAGVTPFNWLTATGATALFTPTFIAADFWGNSLLLWLTNICSHDLLILPELATNLQGTGKNDEALRALKRFEGQLDADENPSYTYGVPMAMTPRIIQAEISRSISDDVANFSFNSLTATSLWDKMVNHFGASYMFMIVPLTNTALIVPFTPGLRQYYTTIYSQEYSDIEFRGNLPRPLRGVAVMAGFGSMTGVGTTQPGQVTKKDTIGGWYGNECMKGGMIVFKDMPAWLKGSQVSGDYARYTLPAANLIANAMFAGAGLAPGMKLPQDRVDPVVLAWDGYAKALYNLEVLQQRTGTLTGKVRFDIAPGSSVRVITSVEPFVALASGIPKDQEMFAMVGKVTTTLNAESCEGATSMLLLHVRSAAENLDDATSTLTHPIWQNVWAGAPLVEDPAFAVTNPPFAGPSGPRAGVGGIGANPIDGGGDTNGPTPPAAAVGVGVVNPNQLTGLN